MGPAGAGNGTKPGERGSAAGPCDGAKFALGGESVLLDDCATAGAAIAMTKISIKPATGTAKFDLISRVFMRTAFFDLNRGDFKPPRDSLSV